METAEIGGKLPSTTTASLTSRGAARMDSLRTGFFSLAVIVLTGGLIQAQAPEWLQSSRDPVNLSATTNAAMRSLPSRDQLNPEDVFTVSGRSLHCATDPESHGACADSMTHQSECGPGRTWVQFTPYLWATQVSGDLTVDGVTAPLELDLSDLWDLLENGEVRGAFMGHLEFGRDHWALFVNGDIISMDPSAQVRRATIETGLTMTLLELGGAVDIFNASESDPVDSPLRVQAIGGVRYNAVDASAILSLPNVNPLVEVDQGEQWVDLFVGSRAIARLSPGVGAFVRGDVGGFGIGTSSEHAWNLVSGLTVDSICGSNLILGYRVFDIEQSLNGGTGSPQGFGVDAVIHGPVMGLSFQF